MKQILGRHVFIAPGHDSATWPQETFSLFEWRTHFLLAEKNPFKMVLDEHNPSAAGKGPSRFGLVLKGAGVCDLGVPGAPTVCPTAKLPTGNFLTQPQGDATRLPGGHQRSE